MGADMKPGDPADRITDAKADGAFQGSHRAGYGDRLARVEDWLRRYPDATLQSGEGAVLLAEIDRQSAEIGKLRAAILRVWRLHQMKTYNPFIDADVSWNGCVACRDGDGNPMPYPCPTLLALDGEDA